MFSECYFISEHFLLGIAILNYSFPKSLKLSFIFPTKLLRTWYVTK